MKQKIKKALEHNQGLTVAVVAAIGLCVWMFGCESQVASLTVPGEKVTRNELQAEIESEKARLSAELKALKAKAAAKEKDLDRQDQMKARIAEIGLAVAQGGQINPLGVGVSLLGVLGVGAVVDNRRKDVHIKTLKNGKKKARS
jgi:hypothetical protein